MISTIVPIYNAANYLETCLKSLIHQTEQDLQIILIDDGSTDNSLSIAHSFAAKDPRILVLQQDHAGQSAARNKGMEHAKGEYIAFVDADDYIDLDWCTRHLEAIEGFDYVQSGRPRNRYQYTVVWQRLYRRTAIENLRFVEGMIYEDILFSVELWTSGATCRIINYDGYHYTHNPYSTTSKRHPESERQVMRELKKRLLSAPFPQKGIVLYTLIRLKIHFLK